MSHAWLLYALSGPVLWAVSTHLDKYLVERYFRGVHPAVLLVFTGAVNLALMPLIYLGHPAVFDIGTTAIVLMTLSGVLMMGAMLLYLMALQTSEASIVAPFFQASPLFAIAMSYFVLGERLTTPQWWGAGLVIAGTFAAAVQPGAGGGRTFDKRLVALMLGCAFTIALTSLVFKIYALNDEFWPSTFWLFAGEVAFAAAILLHARWRAEFIGLFRTNRAALIGINGANELVNLAGGLGTRYALVLAPLSLVQAVSSTTTVFVFLFGLALTLFMPSLGREDLSRGALVRKATAAVLVAVGVALIGA